MKRITKLLILSPLVLGASSALTSCGGESVKEKFTLKIINSEDYIYLDEEDHSNDLVEQFKRYIKTLASTPIEEGGIDPKFANVDVVYDTSDTNETLYSELQTGKSDYDLINVSDYMAQKMVSEELVVPLFLEDETREEKIPNYVQYASESLRSRLDNIEAPIYSKWVEDPLDPEKKVHPYVKLEDYSVGYMWGTLGILFNPEYQAYANYDPSDVLNDMHYSFSSLWNSKYNGSISIKNSMRDTFAAGLMRTYEEDFASLKAAYDDGLISKDEYMAQYAKIFNGEHEENFSTVVNKVAGSLNVLKNNIFGLEVDSGKQDIVTGKIGINLAWSGDAVYAMDQAEDGTLVGDNQSTLYYCVPELGSNLWFDTWVMPKNANRSEERRELALMFLDFLSDPANAMQNMDYTGYTSFIGGAEVLELVRDWYDIRTYEITQEVEVEQYVYEYYDVYAVYDDEDDEKDNFFALDYPDCMKDDGDEETLNHNALYDYYDLYYFVPTEELEEPETIDDIISQENIVYKLDEEGEETEEQKKYGDLLIVNSDENYDSLAVDLSYFFNGTLEGSDYVDNEDTIFYSDAYYADVYYDEESGEYYVEDSDGTKHANNSVGRQFFTQYPDEEVITRCAVMKDFGENNQLVMKMWEEFKSDPLPTSSFIIFMIIIGAGVALGGYFIANKLIQKKIRKKRQKSA